MSTTTRPDARLLGAVAVGGALGSLGRYAAGLALPHAPGGFPWATWMVNLSGAFAMGLLVAFLGDRPGVHRLVRPFVGVGILGGWTTFSALAVETVGLTRLGLDQSALIYLATTFLLGTLAVAAGVALGRRIWASP